MKRKLPKLAVTSVGMIFKRISSLDVNAIQRDIAELEAKLEAYPNEQSLRERVDSLKELCARLTEAQGVIQSFIEGAKERYGDLKPEELPALSDYISEKLLAQSEIIYQNMLEKFGPDHPDVKELTESRRKQYSQSDDNLSD